GGRPKWGPSPLTPHCRPCSEKRSPAPIEGSATIVIVPSRSTMKNAPHSSASAHQRRGSRTADATRPADADDSIVNLQGRSQLPRHDPALGSFGRSVMHTPRRRETGRPRAAQFAPRAVYIPGGGTTWWGRKERRMVTGDLLSLGREVGRDRVVHQGGGRVHHDPPGRGPAGGREVLLPSAVTRP